MLAQEFVGITQAKSELPSRVRQLEKGDVERVVIVRQNSPIAVIVTVGEYDRMRSLVEEIEDLHDTMAALLSDGERGRART